FNELEANSELGTNIVGNIESVVKNNIAKVIKESNDPKLFKAIVSGIRAQLASELAIRYGSEALKTPIPPKKDDLFSLVQALAVDIILPSAIDARKDDDDKITADRIGNGGVLRNMSRADFASYAGNLLVGDDKMVEELLAKMFNSFSWQKIAQK
ncbi:MAG: hypothetical protein FWD58_10555, partial [Firmicutes bacterium]|nr:hypothetical protein [Bacillota bacterium]